MIIELGGAENPQRGGYAFDRRMARPVHVICDLAVNIPCQDNAVDEVFSQHFLEHLSPLEGLHCLRECYRVLRPGGTCRHVLPDVAQVLDLAKLGICDCADYRHGTADPACVACGGLARMSSEGLRNILVGGGRHPWDWHKTWWTAGLLREVMESIGFRDMRNIIAESCQSYYWCMDMVGVKL